VNINTQSSKTNTKKPLNLKKTHHSRAFNQCQSFDFRYNSITGIKRIALFTVLTLGLISNPYFAHAEKNAGTSYLQAVAESNAQELGIVTAYENWERIEFKRVYIDPVVIIEESIADVNKIIVVGTRNVDARGFEIILNNCNDSAGIAVQDVKYSVIEKSQLPSTEGASFKVRQQFSWGECGKLGDAEMTTGRAS